MLNKIEATLTGTLFIIVILAILVALTGCDVTQVPEANRPTVDSIIREDSIHRADSVKPVKSYTTELCVTGSSFDRLGNPQPMHWEAAIVIGSDTLRVPDDTAVCRAIGRFPDTAKAKLVSVMTDGIVDRKYLRINGWSEYDLSWRPVFMRPDSLRRVSDSINAERF